MGYDACWVVNGVNDILVPSSIAIIMFGIGLNLTLENFKRVFIRPKAILTGLTLQMILLPLVGFIIASVWNLPPAYKVGIVLISACPGGTASNLVTHILSGRVALSISMTAFNSFLILFTIPFITSIALGLFTDHQQVVSLSFWHTFQNIAVTVIAPVVSGIFIRHYFENFTLKIKPYLKYILSAVLLIVFLVVGLNTIAGSNDGINSGELYVAIPLLLLNVSTMLIGFWIAGILQINHDGKYTIAIEMGLQNSALAIFVASQILQNETMTLVAIVYSGFSFFTTMGLSYLLKKSNSHVINDH
ncbi:bile acid:sodium symporter family protein [Ekhidna sp.]|uniref:bile acid:sodium symporter family protein n=1 Tax=Ekhidna sp. TaxID=2608089 RepID=UPI0032EC5FC8